MARDRKRAKQRRDRTRRAPSATAERRPRREPGISRAEAEDTHNAPDPLDHASAEVDLANAQMALGRAELEAEEPVVDDGDDGEVYADEIGDDGYDGPVGLAEDDVLEEDQVAAPGRRGSTREALAPTASRVPVPAADGNRVVAFLRASWRELQRVQWPDRRQVAQATGVVIVFVVIVGMYLGLADVVFNKLVDAVL